MSEIFDGKALSVGAVGTIGSIALWGQVLGIAVAAVTLVYTIRRWYVFESERKAELARRARESLKG